MQFPLMGVNTVSILWMRMIKKKEVFQEHKESLYKYFLKIWKGN